MPNPGQDLFEAALAAEGVTGKQADLARSIYSQESGQGRNTKTSNAGAMGGMQIIPSTFAQVADKGWDINNPEHNARAGIRYLKVLDKQAGGDPALTAAGYYGGPGGLEKARKGIPVSDPRNPKAPNTLEYADQVVARAGLASTPVRTAAVPAPVARGATGEVPPPAVFQEPAAPVMAAAPPTDAPMGGVGGTPPGGRAGDAWQEFLNKMPSLTPPLRVADLDFMKPKSVNFSLPPKSLAGMGGRQPNFAAFSAWKGGVA